MEEDDNMINRTVRKVISLVAALCLALTAGAGALAEGAQDMADFEALNPPDGSGVRGLAILAQRARIRSRSGRSADRFLYRRNFSRWDRPMAPRWASRPT